MTMDSGQIDIEKLMIDLADQDRPISNTDLTELSNVTPEEMEIFSASWPDIDVEQRRKIIQRLAELAEDNFELDFDTIFKFGMKDSDPEIRAASIDSLWENEEVTLISPLIKALNEDESELVQVAAAKGLGKYALKAELKKLGEFSANRVSEALLTILKDTDKPVEVWRRALEAAAPLNVPEVKSAIEKAYKSTDLKVKNSAIYAMGRNADAEWMPTLLMELDNESSETRFEAAVACGEMCEEEAVPELIKLTSDTDTQVQQAAVASLGMIGGARAKTFLKKLASGADDILADAAENALNQIKAEEEEFSL